ncbi:chemotaxis protein [Fusibacter ferrireducens]|uniref:Chemotaxis protein n=1 Tax=Fusibacter ferrireducens TaxID=2785058 RepID=A0ABR9ZY84_9FIRM|nr:chemotaxis protein [Fusibacter ferrireducens]MBF4695423.1 chemotaxis protein [Fusibacter ferrireducens]
MIKIGFIDDDKSLVDAYKTRLKRRDIELIFADDCNTKEDVLKWIFKNEIKCMLVDYKLTQAYSFMGTDLVAYLNSEVPDLPCIVLTNYCEEGIGENLVVENMFIDRDVFDAEMGKPKFEDFIKKLEQSVAVFENRLVKRNEEFLVLKEKKDSEEISSMEEERFIHLYKILRAYNEVDDIPSELLTSSASKKMSDILSALDKLIDRTN